MTEWLPWLAAAVAWYMIAKILGEICDELKAIKGLLKWDLRRRHPDAEL